MLSWEHIFNIKVADYVYKPGSKTPKSIRNSVDDDFLSMLKDYIE